MRLVEKPVEEIRYEKDFIFLRTAITVYLLNILAVIAQKPTTKEN